MTRSGIIPGLFLLGLSIASGAQGQDTDLQPEEVKARYLVELARHIVWPEESDLAAFRTAVVSTDRTLRLALDGLRDERVRGLPFSFEYFSGIDFDPEEYAIVYLDRRFRALNRTLFHQAEKPLIVVDGRVDRAEQLVSIVGVSRDLAIALNRANLIARGFKPSISLLELVGTKEDLSEQLRDNQARLERLVGEVAARERELADLNEALEESTRNSQTAQEALARSEAELDSIQSELEQTRRSLTVLAEETAAARKTAEQLRLEIAQQDALLARKQEDVQTSQQAIEALESQIARNQAILESQHRRLDQQHDMLASRNQTILAQRGLLLSSVGALFIFVILVVALLRVNVLRRRANKELKRVNEKLYEQATIDAMTGLYNRRHFLESARQVFVRRERTPFNVAALMLDLDHFKRINDEYGHATGDHVIATVGKIIKRHLRESDLGGRLGGEEYGMLLLNCDVADAMAKAERLREDLAATKFDHAGKQVRVTTSIGVTAIVDEDPDIERALSRADHALYDAKSAGRNRVMSRDSLEDGEQAS